jgi:hypothetical protein
VTTMPGIFKTVSAAVFLFVFVACGPKEVGFSLRVVTSACEGTPPTEGADQMQVRVTGPDLAPLEATTVLTAGELQIPKIPAGTGRVFEVRALAGNQVVALGRSLPFNVPEEVPKDAPPALSVFLRRVNAFTAVSGVTSPETCSRMASARAGHTATLLMDGRVFIAGGYQAESTGTMRRALSEAEVFDPVTGTFSAATEMTRRTTEGPQRLPRAFHAATLLDNGQVLITGGRDTLNEAGGSYAVRNGVVYDPPTGAYLGYFNLEVPRSHHAAVRDRSGRVLIVGGWGTDPTSVVETLEYYDPESTRTLLGVGTVRRVEMGVAALQNGEFVAVAGGSDGAVLKDDVIFFAYDRIERTFKQRPSTLTLRDKRRAAAIAPFQDGNRLFLAGGYSTVESADLKSVATSEVISTKDELARRDGPPLAARGDICAAVLADGRVLTLGGRDSRGGQLESASTAELISSASDGTLTVEAVSPLPSARHFLTCTALKDGTVLVLGGLKTAGGATQTLQDAYIFTPAPLED